ncbi:MAG: ABC transporter ATP-binding protein [Ignavibacteriales bacterium]|jgi:ABC-type multidrug transport system fused ATPase/permease subunit|nr:MAG: ABC transporter ATP-binding protein [Ignavibacteriales bacterium]
MFIKILKEFKVKRGYKLLFLLILCLLLTGFLGIIPIKFIEKIVDYSLTLDEDNVSLIYIYGGLYIGFQIMSPLFRGLSKYISNYLQYSYGISIQNKLYNKLLKVDLLQLNSKNSIELTNTLIEDVEYITNKLFLPITKLLLALITFVIGVYYMVSINLTLTLIILPLGLITSISSRIIQKKSIKNIRTKRQISNKLWKSFAEGIRGVMTLRIYDKEQKYMNQIKTNGSEMLNINLKQSKFESLNLFFVSSLFMLTIGVILVVSGLFVVQGLITVGSMTAILMYNHMITDPFMDYLDVQQAYVKLNVSIKRISELFMLKDDMFDSMERLQVDNILVENVCFSYDQICVLKDINIEISKGEKIAIIGETGSGKTTLVNLLSGLYHPNSGQVLYCYNGNCVQGKPKLAYMQQENYLFDRTINDNIKIVNPDLSEKEIKNLIDLCRLTSVNQQLGENTIGENGSKLSGGERKRLSLAQTLANTEASIYIFDELTSSIDQEMASELISRVVNRLDGKICIFIEHNLQYLYLMNYTLQVKNQKIVKS